MFERFSEPARRALFFARYEASALGKHLIESEHLLLGILREGDPVTTELWNIFGVRPQEIRAKFPTVDTRISSSAELPLSEDAKKILAYTAHECEQRSDGKIGPQHLLLGILRVPDCQAARELGEHGVHHHAVYEALTPIQRELNRVAEIEEDTPVTLRRSHYELLDRIAAKMQSPASLRTSRQSLVLALMDALAASDVEKHRFESTEDFRRRATAVVTDAFRSTP
jgi:ATP-dependent Clp protease ATP-binding subunit ClpA